MALMLSIIAASGPPNWSQVKLPAGRSRQACSSYYNRLLKEASTSSSPDGAKAPAPKRATPKNAKDNVTPTKRKRGSKKGDMANLEGQDDDEEIVATKKQKKVESHDEDVKEEEEEDEDMIIKKEAIKEEA